MFADDPEVVHLGRMAVFLVPRRKVRSWHEPSESTVEEYIDDMLTEQFGGFTKITQNVEGHYRLETEIVKDDHIRYEVSFRGKARVGEFVTFLKHLCQTIEEESIYLTMGEDSYLICPSVKAKPKP